MAVDKVFYNRSSADSLGWEPDWFGVRYHDEELVDAIKKWQKKKGLTGDGLCGPSTYRRVWTERESDIGSYKKFCPKQKDHSFIVCNSKFIEIEWPSVVLWNEDGGLKMKPGTYYDYSGKPDRKPDVFVNHWDVCLSAESCAKVLNKRKISVHFCIDNDGTIYQLLDTQHGAWHAGNVYGNKRGIGVEISNAYYIKYQDWYVKNGYGKRPLQEEAWVHGKKLKPFTDFYPVQVEALKALWKAVHTGIGIPLECPVRSDGSLNTGVDKSVANGRFSGFVNHYNYTKNKIDCAGLDLATLLEEVKKAKK
tara:strand:+ start:9798 stop:10718 length:921 start_codon:yes stop_codon:yes gene_type:complete